MLRNYFRPLRAVGIRSSVNIFGPARLASSRFYSSFNEKLFESEFYKKLSDTPEAIESMNSIMTLLKDKNIVVPGERPSPFAMMRLMTDSEVRGKFEEFRNILDKNDIQMSKEDLSLIMTALEMEK